MLLAPLVIIPIGLNLLSNTPFISHKHIIKRIEKWSLPAAISLAIAYLMNQSVMAGILSLPWLMITCSVAWLGIRGIITSSNNTAELSISAGMLYLSVGGFWALADRMGCRPLDYDPEIVFLTVAHFHYAGFVLPVVAGFVYKEIQNGLTKLMVYGILIGVWFVAAGIVVSQLGGGQALESFAAWWLAISTMLMACLQLKIALRRGMPAKVAVCLSVAGVALLVSMLLAGLYGMRHIYPIPGLDIPMMRALHGSANVFGFGVFAVWGWWQWQHMKGKSV